MYAHYLNQPRQTKQDPGYPHGANAYRGAADPAKAQKRQRMGQAGEGEKGQRLMLNLSYVRPDFPMQLRKHVVTHQYYYRRHLAPQLLRR
jgi:hypothetical protein